MMVARDSGTEAVIGVGSITLLDCLVVVIYAAYKALLCFGAVLIFQEQIKEHEKYLNKCKEGNADGEPKDPLREPSKFDCLTHEPLRLLRKFLCGICGIFSKPDVERDSRPIEIRTVRNCWYAMYEILKLSCRSFKNKVLNLRSTIVAIIPKKFSRFFSSHRFQGRVKPPNG